MHGEGSNFPHWVVRRPVPIVEGWRDAAPRWGPPFCEQQERTSCHVHRCVCWGRTSMPIARSLPRSVPTSVLSIRRSRAMACPSARWGSFFLDDHLLPVGEHCASLGFGPLSHESVDPTGQSSPDLVLVHHPSWVPPCPCCPIAVFGRSLLSILPPPGPIPA
eukprot:scaffold412_cov311-Pavlova_lutheri.AAC.11